jgi:hypothetical protein
MKLKQIFVPKMHNWDKSGKALHYVIFHYQQLRERRTFYMFLFIHIVLQNQHLYEVDSYIG